MRPRVSPAATNLPPRLNAAVTTGADGDRDNDPRFVGIAGCPSPVNGSAETRQSVIWPSCPVTISRPSGLNAAASTVCGGPVGNVLESALLGGSPGRQITAPNDVASTIDLSSLENDGWWNTVVSIATGAVFG